MSTPGISLVGFMSQNEARAYFRKRCVPLNADDAALDAEWQAAKVKLGAPMPSPGQPQISALPASDPHVQAFVAFWGPQLGHLGTWSLELVEIDPLLAFQHDIDNGRSAHHCGGLAKPPTLQELMTLCLPLTHATESFNVAQGPQSMIVHTKSLNLRMMQAGLINGMFIGVHFGPSLPIQHVVRYNGRCYLHNGFHRALGARQAGATHIPCLFRDVATPEAAGIHPGTFSLQLLESADPPTLGHYTQGRAYDVQLRAIQRVLHVSWAEYVVPTE